MNVEKRTIITVSAVPGVAVLNREGEGVTFKVLDDDVFTLNEIRAIRDALTVVLDESPEAPSGDGPWGRIEDVPAHVRHVTDKEGDRWDRETSDRPGYFAGETYEFMNRYAPFRPAW